MNYVQGIQDFFDYITKYIRMLLEFLNVDDFKNLLMYLFNCFPEPVRALLFVTILLLVLVGFVKAFRN